MTNKNLLFINTILGPDCFVPVSFYSFFSFPA